MPLPHLGSFDRNPLVFLTVCTAKRAPILNNAVAHAILLKLWQESRMRNGWCVGRYVVMPDHVHLFAMPDVNPTSFHQWVSTWKSLSARQITAQTKAGAPIWQRDYFDRFLRTSDSYSAKWDYVCNNPARAGLVMRGEQWPYQGVIHELIR